jgi:hypothetical protein
MSVSDATHWLQVARTAKSKKNIIPFLRLMCKSLPPLLRKVFISKNRAQIRAMVMR